MINSSSYIRHRIARCLVNWRRQGGVQQEQQGIGVKQYHLTRDLAVRADVRKLGPWIFKFAPTASLDRVKLGNHLCQRSVIQNRKLGNREITHFPIPGTITVPTTDADTAYFWTEYEFS